MTEHLANVEWENGWDGHEQQQLRRLAELSLADKLQWLEEAQLEVGQHLQPTVAFLLGKKPFPVEQPDKILGGHAALAVISLARRGDQIPVAVAALWPGDDVNSRPGDGTIGRVSVQ